MDSTLYLGDPVPDGVRAAAWPVRRRGRTPARGIVFDTPAGYMAAALDAAARLMEMTLPQVSADSAAEALGLSHLHAFGGPEPAVRLIESIRRYLSGEPVAFDWPLDLSALTPFQREALMICASIPYGQVRTYGWIADRLGRPKAARPVGGAMGANPIPILIPCHRVVGSDGRLVGYGGGMDWKQRLLALEGITPGSGMHG